MALVEEPAAWNLEYRRLRIGASTAGPPYAQFPFFSFDALGSQTNHKNWRPARRFLLSVDQFRQGRYFKAARFQLCEDRPKGGGRAQAAISDVVQDDD